MRSCVLLFILFCSIISTAQRPDSQVTKNTIDSINRLLDRCVVRKDLAELRKLHADDFFTKHASGKTYSKTTWLESVQRNNYGSREHDSVVVELHDQVVIVTGTLNVKFPPGATRKPYAVRYIRVFAFKNQLWQLISHHSTAEWETRNE